MRRVGVIGCGKIGGPVITALQAEEAGNNTLVAVLAQHEKKLGDVSTIIDRDRFFTQSLDLIIDAASAGGLHEYAETALEVANVWTVNAAALADKALYQSLTNTGRQYGHRLRVLTGAIAGLDGLSTLAVDDQMQVNVVVDVAPSEQGRKVLFKGDVQQAAEKFPESVNVSVAAALTGIGLDKTQIEVVQPAHDEGRYLSILGQSKYGLVEVKTVPSVQPDKGIHTVAACIIAALRREDEIIQVY